MTGRTAHVELLLRDANPVPRVDHDLDDRATEDLRRILASSPQPGRQRTSWRRRAVLAGVLAAVTAAGVVGGSVRAGQGWLPLVTRGVAYAATPAPLDYAPVADSRSAAAVLRDIAEKVESLPDDTGHGRYAYVEIRSWNLWTAVDGARVTSEVVPEQTRTWRAEDGSGRVEVTTMRDGNRTQHVEDVGPGTLRTMWPAGSLSADDEVLAKQLSVGHPVENGPAERLAAIQDAYRATPLTPNVRAAMLRYLADTPGLEQSGRVTDRAGRDGLAFSLESDYSGLPTRYTVIVDPESGWLLGSEEMLTTTAGMLNVPVPSVIGYNAYLDSRYTDMLGG